MPLAVTLPTSLRKDLVKPTSKQQKKQNNRKQEKKKKRGAEHSAPFFYADELEGT